MIENIDLFDISSREPDEIEEVRNTTSLTPRQWALYRLIEHNSIANHEKTYQREICDVLCNYGYRWTESNNTSDHCSAIWGDIAAINLSLETDKIIITKDYAYWIGSKSENEEFLAKLWRDLSGRLSRYWSFAKKIQRDGQGKLLDNRGNIMSDKAKRFHECFNEYDIEMKRYYYDFE